MPGISGQRKAQLRVDFGNHVQVRLQQMGSLAALAMASWPCPKPSSISIQRRFPVCDALRTFLAGSFPLRGNRHDMIIATSQGK